MIGDGPKYASEQAIMGDAASVCGSLKGRLESDAAEIQKRISSRASKLVTLHDEQSADEAALQCINYALDNINSFFSAPKPTTAGNAMSDRYLK